MAHVDDIVDLTQRAIDVYFSNPQKNLRTVFIQIDDLCELGMKSYLKKIDGRWSPKNSNNRFKTFFDIINEVKEYEKSDKVNNLLEEFLNRRELRNEFFHNQDHMGLTLEDKTCLKCFLDLFELMEFLHEDFLNRVKATPIGKVQLNLILLLYKAHSDSKLYRQIRNVLKNKRSNSPSKRVKARGQHLIEADDVGYQWILINHEAEELLQELEPLISD